MNTIKHSLSYLDFLGATITDYLERTRPNILELPPHETSLMLALEVIEEMPEEVSILISTDKDGNKKYATVTKDFVKSLYQKDYKQMQSKDAFTELLALAQCVINQFDIMERNGFYQDVFRHGIKYTAKQLKADLEKGVTKYVNATKYVDPNGNNIDMVQNIVENIGWFSKMAFRSSELDPKTMTLFNSQLYALARFYGLPYNRNDVISTDVVTLEDLDNAIKACKHKYSIDVEDLRQLYANKVAKHKVNDVVADEKHIYRILEASVNTDGEVYYKGEYLRKDFRRKVVNGERTAYFFETHIVTTYN